MFNMKGTTLRAVASAADALSLMDFGLIAQGVSLTLRAVSPDKTMMAEVVAPIANGPAEPMQLCHSRERFSDAVGAFKPTDEIQVAIEGIAMVLRCGRKRRAVAMLDKSYVETPTVPKVPWTTAVEVPVSFIQSCIKGAKGIKTDAIGITVAANQLKVTISSEIDSFEDSCDLPEGTVDATCQFTHAYLGDIIDLASGDMVTLYLATDMPLKATMKIGDADATVLLAPRIEQQDD